MSAPTVHVSATPDTPASELGVLRYRLTVLLAHLAVRRPSPEALGDLQVLQTQLDDLAARALDRWTPTSARALSGLLADLRQEIAFVDTLGPQCLTTWEARR